jgi:hypothetical protein
MAGLLAAPQNAAIRFSAAFSSEQKRQTDRRTVSEQIIVLFTMTPPLYTLRNNERYIPSDIRPSQQVSEGGGYRRASA